MARVKNTMKLVDSSLEVINANYDLCASNAKDIYKASNTPCDLIYNGFRFGYMQGMKAVKAKLRKSGVFNG